MNSNHIITAIDPIKEAEFVSVWDGGFAVATSCKVNMVTKEVFGGDEMTLDSVIVSAPDNFVIRDALARCFEVVQRHRHIVCSCSGGGRQ